MPAGEISAHRLCLSANLNKRKRPTDGIDDAAEGPGEGAKDDAAEAEGDAEAEVQGQDPATTMSLEADPALRLRDDSGPRAIQASVRRDPECRVFLGPEDFVHAVGDCCVGQLLSSGLASAVTQCVQRASSVSVSVCTGSMDQWMRLDPDRSD